MAYPELRVYRERMRSNVAEVVRRCAAAGVRVWGVTKGLCGHPEVGRLFLEEGCAGLGTAGCAT